MTREWQPGDVVAGLVDGNEVVGIVRGGGWRMFYADSVTTDQIDLVHVQNLRPLVVIDPESATQMDAVADAIWRQGVLEGTRGGATIAEREAITAALRSLIAPEKPAEPMGLGAVVEVDSTQPGLDGTKKRLVRTHASHEPWWGDNQSREWAEISGPITVLSEGVTP